VHVLTYSLLSPIVPLPLCLIQVAISRAPLNCFSLFHLIVNYSAVEEPDWPRPPPPGSAFRASEMNLKMKNEIDMISILILYK